MRNLFLYCILPMVRNLLGPDRVAHLGLFVIGIRVNKTKIFYVSDSKINPY